jgi:hypothetical protein
MEPAARRLAPMLLSGAGSAPLPAPVKGKTRTGEQANNSGRQLSYAEVGAAYAGVLAARPRSECCLDSSAPLPAKYGASDEYKGRRDMKTSRRAPPEIKSPQRGEGNHGGHHCWRTLGHSPCCTQKAKWATQAHSQRNVILQVLVTLMETTLRRTPPVSPGDCRHAGWHH